MSDVSLLVRSTLKLYLKALRGAFKSLLLSWWLPLAHLLAAVLIAFPLGLVVSLLGIVGSFAAGLALAFAVAAYLASIRAVVGKESQRGVFQSAQQLFFPVIHVLFMFFILELLLGFILVGPNSHWIRACIGLAITVFGNVIPELIYIRGSNGSEIFTDSFEFIVENWVEWILPAIPFVLLLIAFTSPAIGLRLLIETFQQHPLEMIESLVFTFGSLMSVPSLWVYLIVAMYLFYFVVLFRANLFEELLYSSRRKRVYAERTGLAQ